MVPLLEYLTVKAVPFLLGTANALIAFGMITLFGLALLKKKVPMAKLFLTMLSISLVYIIPQFFVEYLFFYPNSLILYNVAVDSFLLFPFPLYIFFYYFLFRRSLGLSRVNAFRILEPVILIQYITLLVFITMSDFWSFLFGNSYIWSNYFGAQIASMLFTDAFAASIFFIAKFLYLNSGKFIEIPYGYPVPDTVRELLRVFTSAFFYYLVVVSMRGLLLMQGQPGQPRDFIFEKSVLYLVLIALLLYRVIEIIQHRRLSIIEWQAKTTDEYIRSLISTNEEFRSLKHDFFNILQVYGGYITTGDLDGLKSYHNSTVKTATRVGTSLDIIDPLSPRKALYSLFSLKTQLAREHDVEMEIFQVGYLVKITMNDLDLCRIMGNLIDNALEAASESAEKKVIIECNASSKDMAHIIISNSTVNPVNIEQLDQKFSTKPNHMGHGLTTVRNIVTLHDRCSMSFTVDGTTLSAHLFLVTDP